MMSDDPRTAGRRVDPSPDQGEVQPDIRHYEPGVDRGAAETTKAAAPETMGAAARSDGSSPEADGSDRDGVGPRRGLWVAIGGGIAVIAVLVLAFLVPQTPAPAWIGIAVQAALFVMLLANARALPASSYRGSRFAWITVLQGVAALVFLLIILVVISLN